MRRLKLFCLVGSVVLILVLAGFPLIASAAPAGGTGLTAKIVATSGQTITGDVDATGYDVGVYIGPGVHDVIVTGAVVHGANDEGILAQDASNIVIKNSEIAHNGVAPFGSNLELKGITLAGTTDVLVKGNTVEDNGAGGISVIDDGPNRPFAKIDPAAGAALVAGTGNVVMDNTVKDNAFDCGIVVSAKNPGAGVSNNIISKNTVEVTDPFLGGKRRVGGIVVAGGALGPVTLRNNVIVRNTVTGGLIPGISIHAFGPGVITGTKLIGNVLSNNGAGELSGDTTGIEIFAVPNVGTISDTQVLSDKISDDHYGVWHRGDVTPHIANLTTTNVAVSVFP